MYKIILGSYNLKEGEKTAGIHTGTFDPENGRIRIEYKDNHSDNPSFLTVSKDKKYLIAANETDKGSALDCFRFQEDGTLKWIDRQSDVGSSCCHVEYAQNGKYVTGTNYGDGSVFSYGIDPQGYFCGRRSFIQHEGSGPVYDRQEHAHAHSIRRFPGSDLLLACDLGADRLFRYQCDENGAFCAWEKQPFIEGPAGWGPRHMEFSTDQKYLYVVGELLNQVVVYHYTEGLFKQIQAVSTLPDDFQADNLAADIHLHPNGKWLYVSNRGHDSIVQFQIEENGMLTRTGDFSCGGKGPRNFAVCETHLLCASQLSDCVTVFAFNASGEPDCVTDVYPMYSPTFVMLL